MSGGRLSQLACCCVRVAQSGQHPLHRAAAAGDVEMVALLLEFGADANERAAWVSRNTTECYAELKALEQPHGR